MQNQQQQMAMAMGANMGGPVNGTPVMGNLQRPGPRNNAPDPQKDPFRTLNTYIYDYFLRNNHRQLAQAMVECDMKMNLQTDTKPSPSGRNVNGVDSMDGDDKLPKADLPAHQLAENSFLGDWWCQFWDIWSATRGKGDGGKSTQYAMHTRSLAQLTNEQRNNRMSMNAPANMNAAQYQNMMRMQGGVPPNDLKRAAMNNRNANGGNPMANMNQMKNPAMMAAQMQRDGSSMDMNGQRPQSPGSADNAPSPNKRQRVEGAMNAAAMGGNFNEFAQQGQNVQPKSLEVYAQNLAQNHRIALNNHAMAQGMNAGVQGSPMAQQSLDGQGDMFVGNQQRPAGMPTMPTGGPGMPAGGPGQPQGNHALQDYQMQLMLLEQQNKRRLLMARQEQDNVSGAPHNVGAPGFAPAMSPQGSRAGPSPNPNDMKRGTPKLNQQGLPGSPMPDATMAQQRNSPTPNMNFDPSTMPGIPPQFGNMGAAGAYPQMGQPQMMRPPSSHPGNFNPQQMNAQQQMEAMRNAGMQNGAWRGPGGPGGPQGMMPGQGQQMGGPMNPQQRNQMPPPPAPAGEQPRAQEPSPSQPAAPPTPSQTNKAAPKKKVAKDNKKPAKAKGANAGATPATTVEETAPTPTPSTPITPMHSKSFQNGQGPPGQAQGQPQPVAAPPQPTMDNSAPPFGALDPEPNSFDLNLDGFGPGDDLNTFDFDSFLQVGDDTSGFGSIGTDFNFDTGVEATGDL